MHLGGHLTKISTLLLAAVLVASTASAATFSIASTGIDSSGLLSLRIGGHGFNIAQPAGSGVGLGSAGVRYYNGAYLADSSASGWLSPSASGAAGVGGLYTYQVQFDLTGLDPSTAVLSGGFATDNDGFVTLNGGAALAVSSSGGFGSFTSFSANSGFVAGINTFEVTVNNGGDPTAFRVQFDRADAQSLSGVPEPGSWALLATGLGAITLRRKSAR